MVSNGSPGCSRNPLSFKISLNRDRRINTIDLELTARYCGLLGDRTRLRLLALVEGEELTVAELAAITHLAQPRVSTHLAKLRESDGCCFSEFLADEGHLIAGEITRRDRDKTGQARDHFQREVALNAVLILQFGHHLDIGLNQVMVHIQPDVFAFVVDSDEGIWNSGAESTLRGDLNQGYRPRYKEGYFPVSPHDTLTDIWGSPYVVDGKVYVCTNDGYVYVYSTGFQRDKPIILHRVRSDRITDLAAYEPWGWRDGYWAWGHPPTPILTGRFGELCLRPLGGKWVLTWFNAGDYRIDGMIMDTPTSNLYTAYRQTLIYGGAWGAEDDNHVAQLYGGYVIPGSTLSDLHLSVSQWNTDNGWPYRVMQFRVRGFG